MTPDHLASPHLFASTSSHVSPPGFHPLRIQRVLVEGRGSQFMTSFMGKRDGIGWNVIVFFVFHMFIQTSPNDPNV